MMLYVTRKNVCKTIELHIIIEVVWKKEQNMGDVLKYGLKVKKYVWYMGEKWNIHE